MLIKKTLILLMLTLYMGLIYADEVYRQTFHHKRGPFTDSKEYFHRIYLPPEWQARGLYFYRFETIPTGDAIVKNTHLSPELFTFTIKIKKSFISSAEGTVVVLLYARPGGYPAYPNNPYYPPAPSNPQPQYPTASSQPNPDDWYYPGESYYINVDPNRKISYVEVRWRDSGGNAKGILYADNIHMGIRDVGNGQNALLPDTDRWVLNRSVRSLRILIQNDAAQILSVRVYYGTVGSPNNHSQPDQSNPNTSHSNPHIPGHHPLPIPH